MARQSGRVETPPIQDRPADPPNPVRQRRVGREQQTLRRFEVTGPKNVGGKTRGEIVELSVTDAQAQALISAGHVQPVVEKPVAEKSSASGDAGTPASAGK